MCFETQSGCEALSEVLPFPTQLTCTNCIFFASKVVASDLSKNHHYGFLAYTLDQHGCVSFSDFFFLCTRLTVLDPNLMFVKNEELRSVCFVPSRTYLVHGEAR